AAAVRTAGIRHLAGRVYGDESWFDALRGGPASGYGLDLDIGGPLGGLLYDRGLAKEDGSALQRQPALFAAQQLTLALRSAHVSVPRGVTGTGTAPEGATQLAAVDSPPMATLVKLTLVPSDNLFAEMLLKDVGAQFGASGSTTAGAAVVLRTAARTFHVHPRIVDGSGLSRADRTSPHQVVVLLNAMRANSALRAGLPVAGRTGTLADRMRHTSAQDRCQAKTGTLSNVSALAGYCTTANGHLLAFAFIENHVYTPTAKAAEDKLAIALARYRPSGAPPSTPTPTPAPTSGATPIGRVARGSWSRGPARESTSPATGPARQPRRALARRTGQQLQQPRLIKHRHPQPLGLLELRAGRLAGDDVVGSSRHRRRDPPAGGEDPLGR